MESKTYEYEDPTGGGDDAKLVLPVIFNPPSEILVTDQGGDRYYMDLVGEAEE